MSLVIILCQHLSCFFIAYNFFGKPFFGGRARSHEGRDALWLRAPSTPPAVPAPGEKTLKRELLNMMSNLARAVVGARQWEQGRTSLREAGKALHHLGGVPWQHKKSIKSNIIMKNTNNNVKSINYKLERLFTTCKVFVGNFYFWQPFEIYLSAPWNNTLASEFQFVLARTVGL